LLADRSVKGWAPNLSVVNGSEGSAKRRAAPGARSAALYLLVALFSGLAGFAAVYVTWGRPDNAAPVVAGREAPAPAAAPRAGINPLSTGEMTAFRFHLEPRELANVRFVDASGAPRSLSDWKGKVVLLNLWATWCAPCRKEMPALDRLQQALGSETFEVVALNLDRGGVDVAKKFLDQIGIAALKLYADPSTRASTGLNAVGMPTTILIDRQGRELGRLVGPAEWDSADAHRLIAAALK
jgi:thiol-disulfide isomerase/thioredoxin